MGSSKLGILKPPGEMSPSFVSCPDVDMQPWAAWLNAGRSVSKTRRWVWHLHRQLLLQSDRNTLSAASGLALQSQTHPLAVASSAEGRNGVGTGVQPRSAPFSGGERSGQYFPAQAQWQEEDVSFSHQERRRQIISCLPLQPHLGHGSHAQLLGKGDGD